MKLPVGIQRKMFARRGGGGRAGGAEIQGQDDGGQRGKPEGGGELHENNLGNCAPHGKLFPNFWNHVFNRCVRRFRRCAQIFFAICDNPRHLRIKSSQGL
jgi:hypothetical protein